MHGLDEQGGRDHGFARDETASVALENALLLALVAVWVYLLKETTFQPMLQRFVDAANTISRILNG